MTLFISERFNWIHAIAVRKQHDVAWRQFDLRLVHPPPASSERPQGVAALAQGILCPSKGLTQTPGNYNQCCNFKLPEQATKNLIGYLTSL